jgi:AraC-like DNA-binding protein
VAQALSLSESRIAHLLTATGLGFCDHVHLARTSEAARLLLETGLSIKEITAAVGYAAGGLDRPFAARFGAAPREWRKQRHLQSVRCLSAGGTDG